MFGSAILEPVEAFSIVAVYDVVLTFVCVGTFSVLHIYSNKTLWFLQITPPNSKENTL